jgi:dTDP-4-amino-4,6-dideoxygalactose transaminase
MLSLLPSEYWDYGPIDMARGLITALSPLRHDADRIIDIPGIGPCVPTRSARAAIVLALKALGLAPGAGVGVPLYCCPVVFKAIKAAGCRARFIDVDPDTYCLSAVDLAAKSTEIDAIIAVHMFGNVCDMDRLRASAPGKPFIEDCAQALGSRLDGRPVGSLGDIAAFSFHSGKYMSVGEGGAIYAGDTGLLTRLSELNGALPIPGRVEECVHVATTCLRSSLRSRPLWGLIGARLWEVYSRRVSYTSQSPLVLAQVYETDRATTVRRLPRLNSWIERQRSNADYYSRVLRVEPGMFCSETPGAFYNRLQYPLLVPTSEQCERLAAGLRENGISTARPYKDIAAIASAHYGYTGGCPHAERIARSVIVIPSNHSLATGDVKRIAACVNRVWAQIGRRLPGADVDPIPSR